MIERRQELLLRFQWPQVSRNSSECCHHGHSLPHLRRHIPTPIQHHHHCIIQFQTARAGKNTDIHIIRTKCSRGIQRCSVVLEMLVSIKVVNRRRRVSAMVYPSPRSTQPDHSSGVGAVSTSERWNVNRYTARCISSVASQGKLVSD